MIIDGLQPLATEIGKLKLLPGNPRKGDIQAVARSLEAFGQRKPIVAITDGTVIAGNHTLQAAESLGWTEIAVVFVKDDEATAKAYALADNRTAELGGYDNQALADLISDVQLLDKELFAATGWDNDDLLEILNELGLQELPTAFTDLDDIPEPPPEKTVPGDVWLLGSHRLVCGDSTQPETIAEALGGQKADLVWTDPPYGISYQKDLTPEQAKALRKRTDGLSIKNDDLRGDDLALFLRMAFEAAIQHCRLGASWFVSAPQGGNEHIAFMSTLIDLGIYREPIIWVKDVLVLSRSDYHYRHEPILYGWVPGAAHTPPPDRTQTTVWEIPRPKRSPEHPTMKPVALPVKSIENHTKPGDVVLDMFAGSGTVLIAAHSTGRTAALVELDPHYVDVICRRFQEHTGIKPINQATNQEHDFLED